MSDTATIITDMRSAARAHLLSITLPMIAGDVTITGNVLTIPTGGLIEAGFKPGFYVTITGGDPVNEGPWRCVGMDDDSMTFDVPLVPGTGTVALSVSLPKIEWQDEAGFIPVPSQPHLTEVFRRVGGKPVLMGGQWRHDMLLTLTLFWPSGQGTIGPESMAGRLWKHFRPGTGLLYGSNKGKVINADQAPSLTEPVWTAYPVTASVAAWTAN